MAVSKNNSGRRGRFLRNSSSRESMSRGRFLRTAGVAAAGVGATMMGAGTVSHAAPPSIRRVPSQYSTIQAAIDASIEGDTILIAPGAYGGDSNGHIFVDKPLTLEGEVAVGDIRHHEPASRIDAVLRVNGNGSFKIKNLHINSLGSGWDLVLGPGFGMTNGIMMNGWNGSVSGSFTIENCKIVAQDNCLVWWFTGPISSVKVRNCSFDLDGGLIAEYFPPGYYHGNFPIGIFFSATTPETIVDISKCTALGGAIGFFLSNVEGKSHVHDCDFTMRGFTTHLNTSGFYYSNLFEESSGIFENCSFNFDIAVPYPLPFTYRIGIGIGEAIPDPSSGEAPFGFGCNNALVKNCTISGTDLDGLFAARGNINNIAVQNLRHGQVNIVERYIESTFNPEGVTGYYYLFTQGQQGTGGSGNMLLDNGFSSADNVLYNDGFVDVSFLGKLRNLMG